MFKMRRNQVCLHWKVLLVALVVQTSAASAECVEPVVPSCVDQSVLFSGQQEFDQCRQAVETFRGKTKEYLLCLKSEVGSALDHFNDAVDRFNQRAHVSNESVRSSKLAKELLY
jgi:hypothetical protein